MDHRTFDRLTQRVGSAGSRRQALEAFLGAALVGVFRGEVAAKPKPKEVRPGKRHCGDVKCPSEVFKGVCCSDGYCSCGANQECCEDRCFWKGNPPTEEFCCTRPENVICGDGKEAKCCKNEGSDPCAVCQGPSGIAGSYRRP